MYCDVFIMVLTVPLIRLCNASIYRQVFRQRIGQWYQSSISWYGSLNAGCGTTAGKDTWTATASINIDNITILNPIISIETDKPFLIICTIDLTACSPDSLPESGDACICHNNSNNYDIEIRQMAIKEISNQLLIGEYKCRDSRACDVDQERYVIGHLPLVHHEHVTSKYSIVGCQETDVCNGKFKEFETQSATVSLLEGQDIQVKMCVHNLINGSVSVESSDIKFTDCGDYKLNTGAAGETTPVTWSYTETSYFNLLYEPTACQRTGKYELRILALNSGSKKSSGSKACPNVGVTLAALFTITTAVSKGWTINAIF